MAGFWWEEITLRMYGIMILEGVHRLRVGDGDVLGPAGVMEHGVLRPDAGVVQAGGDGVDRGDLPVRVLTEVGLHAVEDAQLSGGDGGGGVRRVRPAPRRLTADEADGGIRDEVVEGADGVGAAAHTGQHRVGELPLLLQQLRPDLPGDDRLEVPHHGGEGVGPHDGAQTVVGVVDPPGPLSEGGGAGVLQGAGPLGDRDHLRPQKAHPVDVEGLTDGILLPHKDHALHAEQGGGGGGGHPVLPGPGFSNETALTIFLASKAWPSTLLILWAPVWFRSSRLR